MKNPKDMTIKEFMDWYMNEFENNVNPEHYFNSRTFLDGFIEGREHADSRFVSASTLLTIAGNFFEIIRKYTK